MAPSDGYGHVILQLILGLAVREGCFAMKQFIDEHPKGPDISFGTIDVLNQSLRGHVDGRAYIDILEFSLGQFGKTKICQFGLTVMDEYVCHLQVPVDYMIFCQIK